MSNSVFVKIESGDNFLQIVNFWIDSDGYFSSPPLNISPNTTGELRFFGRGKAGVWYRVVNPSTDDEVGFVAMSFESPDSSSNKAEGSPDDTNLFLISAGLQTYDADGGDVLNIKYKVGTPNLACWDDDKKNNNKIKCQQTNFGDARAFITLHNTQPYEEYIFGEYWNDNSKGIKNWYWEPCLNDVPKFDCKRTVILIDNDRAGIFLQVMTNNIEKKFSNLSFTNPYSSSAAAEGSPNTEGMFVSPGLQTYHKSDTPVKFEFRLGEDNKACWSSDDSNDGKTECEQTTFANTVALIKVINNTPETLNFESFWNDNSNHGKDNWYITPDTTDTIPPTGNRLFFLKSRDMAGIFFKISYLQYHLTFVNPLVLDNKAEGSPFTGLQKYKERGTPVDFTYKVGKPNEACWASGETNDGKIVNPQTQVKPDELDRWMGKALEINSNFFSLRLCDTYLPGSHDTACFTTYSSSPSPYIQTQELDFYTQLKLGIRYFDLRPTYTIGYQGYYIGFHHSSWIVPPTLDYLIAQVKEFYEENWGARKNEIIIFDFTHFDDSFREYPDSVQFFFDQLNKLNEYFISPNGLGPTSSLRQLIASEKGRIIASVNFDPRGYQNTGKIWNGKNLFAPGWGGTAFWPDTSSTTELIDFLNKMISHPPQNVLWVLQDILTPSQLNPRSIHQLSFGARDVLYGSPGQEWKSGTNIVIQDYFDLITTVEALVENLIRAGEIYNETLINAEYTESN